MGYERSFMMFLHCTGKFNLGNLFILLVFLVTLPVVDYIVPLALALLFFSPCPSITASNHAAVQGRVLTSPVEQSQAE